VRRLIALLVIALVGATLFGLSNASSGLSVNGTSVSNTTFRGELVAIRSNTTLQCYVKALAPATYTREAGASVAMSGATAWANLRVEGLAIEHFARVNLKFHPTATVLARAKTSLLSELTQVGTNSSTPCTGSSAQAFAAMPPEMQTFEVASQAASLYLVTKLHGTTALTAANVKKYYDAHVANYDTLCVSIALVTPAQVAAFTQAQGAGGTVAELAKQFSEDPSGQKGGAYGCYAPTSTSYSGVRADSVNTPLNTFPTTPQYVTLSDGSTAALFVAPTKRTVTPLAQAQNVVLSDLETANATIANNAKESILLHTAIAVDPAYGRWGLTSTGPTLFAPAQPAKADVGTAGAATALSSAGSSTYK
jgi:hypothetical protein